MAYTKQQTPYGFNSTEFGSLTVYSAKVRFKDIKYVPDVPYLNVQYYNEYCTISFEVIDRNLAEQLWDILGTLCYNVAKAKLENRYGWVKNK